MDRHRGHMRVLVIASLAVLLLFSQLTVASAQEDRGNSACAGRGIPESRIGIQQFTYFTELIGPNADGIEAVVAHMGEVGMRNIERFGGTFGLTLEEYGDLFDEHHVRPVASHGSLNLDTWDQTLADAKALGQKYVGSGGFGGPGFGSLEDTLQTAANLNELGRRAHRQGLKLFGHNHDGEFTTRYPYDVDGDGDLEDTSVLEILLAETDPRYVSFEVDIHWARVGLAGGRVNNPDLADNLADPSNQVQLLEFLDRYADRIPMLHVKDTATNGSITEVGQGTTNWPDVFRTADHVKHYFIEYDFPPNPYFTAENGFEYLTCLLY